MDDKQKALVNCDAIEKVHPDLQPVLEIIRKALQPVEVDVWRDIESAPKDGFCYIKGRDYLLDDDTYVEMAEDFPDYEFLAFYNRDFEKEGFDWIFMGKAFRPTHWKPHTKGE